MEQMPRLPILSRGNSHAPLNPNSDTHTSRLCIMSPSYPYSTMSHRLVSYPFWKPLAPNGRAEGRFNFIKLPCRLEVSIAARNPIKYRGRMFYLLYRSLSLINMSREDWRGSPTVAMAPSIQISVCRCISLLINLRNGPSVSPSPFLLADHRRHRNTVAKYLSSSTCLMVDLTTGKA